MGGSAPATIPCCRVPGHHWSMNGGPASGFVKKMLIFLISG